MKKFLSYLLYGIIFVVAVPLTAEGILRLCNAVALDPGLQKRLEYFQTITTRIYGEWVKTDETDPFRPPFLVYSNKGSRDAARLQHIYETTKLPPSQTWTSVDFVQPKEIQKPYTIHSNSLGFRGREIGAKKAPGTVRVITLGTYSAFGIGVEDGETYSAHLERELNRIGKGKKFEVWNGGRQGATAIIGLARLQHELLAYQPDVLVLDYGMVDSLVYTDNVAISMLRLPDTPGFKFVRKILQPALPLLGKSLFWRRFTGSGGNKGSRDPERIELFREAMTEILRVAKENKISVIMLKQPTVFIESDVYKQLTGPGVSFVESEEIFQSYPLSRETWRYDQWRSTWLSEMPEWVWRRFWDFRLYPFRMDIFQISPLGHEVLGKYLASEVLTLTSGKKP